MNEDMLILEGYDRETISVSLEDVRNTFANPFITKEDFLSSYTYDDTLQVSDYLSQKIEAEILAEERLWFEHIA